MLIPTLRRANNSVGKPDCLVVLVHGLYVLIMAYHKYEDVVLPCIRVNVLHNAHDQFGLNGDDNIADASKGDDSLFAGTGSGSVFDIFYNTLNIIS